MVLAEPPPAGDHGSLKVAVLRTTEGQAAETATAVDGALLRDLSSLAGIENPTVSPIDYAEIQLTVGCNDEGRQCLASIAQLVQVDAVVVRRLSIAPGRVTLTLVHFDATAADQPARAEQTFEGPDAQRLAIDAVPSLVRRLFGIPEPVVAAAALPAPAPSAAGMDLGAKTEPAPERQRANIRPLTWVTLAAGSGLLAGGIVAGAAADSDFADYKKTPVKTMSDALRAGSKFDAVKSKALLADILIPSGAVVMALAATLFVLDLTRAQQEGPRVALQPLRGGALLTLQGVSGGM